MKAEDIARAERGHKTLRGWLIRCPAHDEKRPSCSIADGDRGLLIKCFAGCSQEAVVAAAKKRGWMEATGKIFQSEKRIGKDGNERRRPDDRPPDPRVLELWSAAKPIQSTIVETYLAGRGLLAPAGDAVLRFHPRSPFKLDNGEIVFLPAMISLFRHILSNEPCGIHRTALKADGSGKADLPGLGNPKKMLGRAGGAAIKLSPDDEVLEGVGIGEGIETCLAVMSAGWRPVWALGSAGAIATFQALAGVECLSIFADADEAGLKAARDCQSRWLEAGRECRIVHPRADGLDWNDVSQEANA
jgi:hypothetical protein